LEELRQIEVEENKEAKVRWENKNVEMLWKDSMKWSEAQNLSNFIHELEKHKDLSKEQEDWIIWAKGVVADLDPLSEGVGELMDQYEVKDIVDSEL